MKWMNQLRKVLSVALILVVMVVSVGCSNGSKAIARDASSGADYQANRGNSVDAYHQLQAKTYEYRNEGGNEAASGSQTSRIGNRLELTQRTSEKLQDRMDNRRDLTSEPEATEKAAKNLMNKTDNALQRSSEKVRGGSQAKDNFHR